MLKHLTVHGNSSALVIDKPILELLNISMDTPLEVTTDGRNLIISPIKNAKSYARINEAMERVNKKHASTLKKLAG